MSESLTLDKVEGELAKLWEEESRSAGGSRAALLTLVAMVSEPRLLERAEKAMSELVRIHPARTIAAVWRDGVSPSISAEIAMHRASGGEVRAPSAAIRSSWRRSARRATGCPATPSASRSPTSPSASGGSAICPTSMICSTAWW